MRPSPSQAASVSLRNTASPRGGEDDANRRTNRYGARVQNRARFLLEVVDTVLGVWPAGQVGVCLGNGSVADNRIKSPIIMKLYVGNLSFDMTERTLRELFEPFGTVTEVKLITDRETGESRGFGFVTMSNVSEGNAAIKGLDGKDKGGRKLTVNEARPKDDRGGRPSPGSRR